MGLILTRNQPQGLARLSPTNPLNRGIGHAYGVNVAGPRSLLDVAGNASGVLGPAHSWVLGPNGWYLNFDNSVSGTTQFLPIGNASASGGPSGTAFSLQGRMLTTMAAATATIYGGGVNGAFQFRTARSVLNFLVSGVAELGSSNTTIPTGQEFDFGLSYDGSNYVFYFNGLPDGSGSASGSFGSNAQFGLGARASDNSEPLPNLSRLIYFNVWNRVRPAAEFKEHAAAMWNLYAPPQRIKLRSAAATNPSLSGSPTDSPDTSTGSASLTSVGSSSTTDSPDTSSGVGAVGNTAVASGNATDSPDTSAGSVALRSTVTGATTDQPDTASGTGAVGSSAFVIGSPTDQPDTSAASGNLSSSAGGVVMDSPDTAVGMGMAMSTNASFSGWTTDGADSITAAGNVTAAIGGSATDSPDYGAGYGFNGTVATLVTAAGATKDGQDTSAGFVELPNTNNNLTTGHSNGARVGPGRVSFRHDYNAICDRCGFEFKASQLRRTWEGFYVCSKDWEPRHPHELFRDKTPLYSIPFVRQEQPDRFVLNDYPIFSLPVPRNSPAPQFTVGLNLSGAENPFPTWATREEMAYWAARGINKFRYPMSWDDAQPNAFGPLDTTSSNYVPPNGGAPISYMGCLSQVLANAALTGTTILFDAHNSGYYKGTKIALTGSPGTPASFADFWGKMAAYFKADPNYAQIRGYDLMNEWHDMDPSTNDGIAPRTPYAVSLLLACNQQATNAIRATGDVKTIHYEGLHYSGAWDWVPNNGDWMLQLVDPADNQMFHVHCYLDRDSSGIHFAYAVEAASPGYAPPGLSTNPMIGPQRMAAVTAWAATNGKRLCLGETGWANDEPTAENPNCLDDSASWNAAGRNMLAHCLANKIEFYLWGGGAGFPTSYGYNPEPRDLVTGGRNFTATGFQSSQAEVLEEFSGYTGPQPTSYSIDRPFVSTGSSGKTVLYGTPGQPLGAPGSDPNTTYFPFRARYNGVLRGPAIITPYATKTDGVTPALGSFTPASITLAPGINVKSGFTFTASNAETILIGATNNQGWTDPPLQSISTINDVYHGQLQDRAPTVLLSLRREYTPYVGPVVRLQRDSDQAQQDFYFNNIGNLPRQQIQDWAGNNSIRLLTQYHVGPVGGAANKSGERNPVYLDLKNSAGYPEVKFPVGFNSGMDVFFDTRYQTRMSIQARVNSLGGDQFLREDYYTGPIAFTLGGLTISDPRQGGTFYKSLSQSLPQGAYHSFGATFVGNRAAGMNLMLDGATSSSTDTYGYSQLHTNGDFGNDYRFQLGWFVYYSPSYFQGSIQSLRIWADEITAAEQTILNNADATYYSTALPDTLSSPPPMINNGGATSVYMGRSGNPFGGVTITDPSNANDSATITLSGAAATLSGAGLTGTNPYSLAATSASSLGSQLQALVLTPTGAVGSATNLHVVISSASGTTGMRDFTSTVAGPAAAETPYAAPSGTFTPLNYKGVNISGGELGAGSTRPYGYDFVYPRNEELDYFAGKGFGLIRVPLNIRRLQPVSYGPLSVNPTDAQPAPSQGHIAFIRDMLDHALSKNMWVVLDPHEYGYITDTFANTARQIGTDTEGTAQFADWWTRIATKFKNYPNVIWGLMNEPHDQTAAQWKTGAVAAMNGIAGVTTARLTLIPGTHYTDADTFGIGDDNAVAWSGYTPPSGLPVAYELHRYLDSDNSGTHAVCVGNGNSKLTRATAWARQQNVKLFLGEFGWSTDSTCTSDAMTFMSYMTSNSDAWLGWSYFNGGSSLFYGSYMYGVVPTGYPTGPFTDRPQMTTLTANL